MEIKLEEKLKSAVWAARSLFERGKATGSSANMSFRHGDRIYITCSGSCFGTLEARDFVPLTMDGRICPEAEPGTKPSKEWPLHLTLFEKSSEIGAVIHVHSLYSVLWSFVPAAAQEDCIPDHTPYLRMKLGSVGLIPYEKPGSPALFEAFRERAEKSDGFLLKNHYGRILLSGGAGRKRPYCLGTAQGRAGLRAVAVFPPFSPSFHQNPGMLQCRKQFEAASPKCFRT